MSRLLLATDDEHEIVLAAPRSGPALLALVLLVLTAAVLVLLPGQRIAPAVLGVFALWALSETARVHRLELDLERRRYLYRRGWLFSPTRREGTFDDLAGVVVDRNEALDGLAASKLRSRVVALELKHWPGEENGGVFPLGFPMGPRAAAENAARYARRLGVGVVDRTLDPEQDGTHGEDLTESDAAGSSGS